MFNIGGRLVALAATVFLISLASSQCSKPAPQAPAAPQAGPPRLLSEMTPVVSVKELMASMIDPVADNIFDAVWWEITPKGRVEHQPKTDEDWEKVKVGAVSLAEGIYLLKVPRPMTPPGDLNNSAGPNAPELSPTEIKAKIDKAGGTVAFPEPPSREAARPQESADAVDQQSGQETLPKAESKNASRKKSAGVKPADFKHSLSN